MLTERNIDKLLQANNVKKVVKRAPHYIKRLIMVIERGVLSVVVETPGNK